MSDFNISSSQTTESNPEARAQLDAALASFASKPVISGTVNSTSPSIPGQVSGEQNTLVDEENTEGLTAASEDGEEAGETTEDSTEEATGFDQEFETKFGVKPAEAVEIINSLSAFRDEMQLMRQWGVSPVDYDGRMSQVKEFYQTLPEDKQSEFNTAEGAKAIWEHISKTTGATQTKASTVSKVGGSKKPASATTSKAPLLKKSEILGMDKASYAKNLSAINKAWREGRVIEDI